MKKLRYTLGTVATAVGVMAAASMTSEPKKIVGKSFDQLYWFTPVGSPIGAMDIEHILLHCGEPVVRCAIAYDMPDPQPTDVPVIIVDGELN